MYEPVDTSELEAFLGLTPKNEGLNQEPDTSDLEAFLGIKADKPGRVAAGLASFNNGVERFTQGVMQPILENIPGSYGKDIAEGSKKYAEKREALNRQAEEAYPWQSAALNFIGNAGATIPLMAIPGVGVAGGAGKAGKFASSALDSFGLQGLASGLGQYVNEGDSRLINGALGYGLSKFLPYAANKGTNAMLGNYADEAAKGIEQLGQRWGVSTFASDSANTPKLNAAAQALEEVPFIGLRGPREAQMSQQINAASGVSDKYRNIMDETSFGGRTGLPMIERAARDGGKRSSAAKDVLRNVQNAGDDIDNVIKASGEVQTLRKKIIADQKYDRVEKAAVKFGPINTNKVVSTIDAAIEQANNSALPDQATINTLTLLRDNFTKNKFDYKGLRNTMSDLSGEIRGYYTGKNSLVGENGVGSLQMVKNSLQDTLDSFAKSNGHKLKGLWQDADSFYRNNNVPLKNAQIANTLKKETDPDKIYSTFVTNASERATGKPNRLYMSLDNKGRAAVRYGMIDEAFRNAYDPQTKNFSSATFDTTLDKKAGAYNVFFKGAEKAELDGFKNLMRHTQRASIALNKPETGVKNIAPILTGGAAIGAYIAPVAAAKVIGGTALTRALLTTPAGKRLLLASSKTPPGSPRMQMYYEQALGLASRGSGAEAINQLNQR